MINSTLEAILSARRATLLKSESISLCTDPILTLEVEIRKILSEKDFYTLLNWMITQYKCSSYIREYDEIYKYDTSNTNLRVTRSRGVSKVCMKYRHCVVDVDGLRIAYSSERQKPDMVHDSVDLYLSDSTCVYSSDEKYAKFDIIRDKSRYVFDSTHCEIHFTIVNASSYCVEVEAKVSTEDVSLISSDMCACIGLFTPLPPPVDAVTDVYTSMHYLINSGAISDAIGKPFVLQKPIDLTFDVFRRNSYLGGIGGIYTIATRKVDGLRAILVANLTHIVEYSSSRSILIGDVSTDNIPLISIDKCQSELTILDSEKTIDNGQVTYHVFDCILVAGAKVYTEHYETRHMHAVNTVRALSPYYNVCIYVKPYHKYVDCVGSNGADGLGDLVSMYHTPDNDGLILYHPNTPYNHDSTVSKVFKWKYVPTVDVLVKDSSVYAAHNTLLTLSVDGIPSSKYQGVVECKVCDGRLQFLRFRQDKIHPNSKAVVDNIVLHKPLTMEMLTGTASIPILMRIVHNQVKAGVIRTQRGNILDVGSGNGADVNKWNSNSSIRRVVCVEPSQSRISTLRLRIGANSSRYEIVHLPLHEYNGRRSSFDYINAFFVLNDVHPDNYVSFFSKCNALLKPCGILSLIFLDYTNIPPTVTCSYFTVNHSDGISVFNLHGALFNDDGCDSHTEYSALWSNVSIALNTAGFFVCQYRYITRGFMTKPESALSSHYILVTANKKK